MPSMIDAPDTIVVSLEGRTLKAVACTRDESLTLCATILRQGDLLATRTLEDAGELQRLVDDMHGMEFVEGTRSAILRWVATALDAAKDDARDSGRDGPEDDGNGDVLAAARWPPKGPHPQPLSPPTRRQRERGAVLPRIRENHPPLLGGQEAW